MVFNGPFQLKLFYGSVIKRVFNLFIILLVGLFVSMMLVD